MIKYLLQKNGTVITTIIISVICIIASVLITSIIWILTNQPNFHYAIVASFVCPSVIAPVVVYYFSKSSDELLLSENKLKEEILVRQQVEEKSKKLEFELRQTQKMEAIGTLAGGIAHDFNNILTAILGNAELALDYIPENSPARNCLDLIREAGIRASDLVRQILSFSRKADQELLPIQPSVVVKEVVKLLRSTIPTTVEIRQNIDPECGTTLADPTQIHQVLMNLCANAVYAMEEKGVLEICLELTTLGADDLTHRPDMMPGAYIRLSVGDTGSGMDEQTTKRIFDPFFTTKEVGRGTGMGLAVVHGIVTAHQGMIAVDSTPGQGTTFNVYFAKADSEEVAPMETGQPLPTVPTGNERILFVDDDEGLVNMWKMILDGLGYHVATKTSSQEALEVFSSQPEAFDLVITDQTMPGMTGVELAQELMGIRPDIPIILYTGYSSKVSIKEAQDMKIRKFFVKPVEARQLAMAIREIFDENKALRPMLSSL